VHVYIYINILIQSTLTTLSNTVHSNYFSRPPNTAKLIKVTISTNVLQQIVCNLVVEVTNKRTDKQTEAKSLQIPQR